MAPLPSIDLEREKLLQLAEDYRHQGYDISFNPRPEDLPPFLKSYRPDLVVYREDEAVVVEVKSHAALTSPAETSLSQLAQVIQSQPGWRLELVVIDSQEDTLARNAANSLKKSEILAQFALVSDLASKHPESAFLYAWSLTEAACRLVTEHEGLSLKSTNPLYLIKQLITAGVISRADYQYLLEVLSSRNLVAHGFRAQPITEDSVHELVNITKKLLEILDAHPANI